ncbi:Ubiquitin-conjugating enzyme E2 10, partial [Frankliniella fusca]
ITPTDNLFVWTATINGPSESPYRGGKFQFTFTFTGAYPRVPPKVKCNTKMFHCNINMNGDVCLNIIKGDWSPIMTATEIAVGLQQLLLEAN